MEIRTINSPTETPPAPLIWFTGLSGAGKTTLSMLLGQTLRAQGIGTQLLDGDKLRAGLCKDLGFSAKDRSENIRRAGEVAKLFMDAGLVTLAAFMSPKATDRQMIRELVGHDRFIEIYCRCPLAVCEQRDTKGLYKRARQGQIEHMVGLHSPYEEPEAADLTLDTHRLNETEALECIVRFLADRKPPGPFAKLWIDC